jgi:hypothetical protein
VGSALFSRQEAAGSGQKNDPPASPEGRADGGQARLPGETEIRSRRSEVRGQLKTKTDLFHFYLVRLRESDRTEDSI